MKKSWIYIVLAVFEMAFGLAYGFLLQNVLTFEFCLIVAFIVPFTVLSISFKESRDTIVNWKKLLLLSLFLMLVFSFVFFKGNQLHGEFIDEYDVTVEYVNYRGGGYANFTTPQGKEGSVDLHDYRPIIIDDDRVDLGDKIRVREYKGIFNEYYYVFVEEIH